jgi:hypothetical protein
MNNEGVERLPFFMEFSLISHHSNMRNRFSILLMLTTLLFSQCKNQEKAMVVPTNDRLHCHIQEVHFTRYSTEIIVSDIFYVKDSLQFDILPLTKSNDSSDLRVTIQKNFKYSEMCVEMQYQGKVCFEISKDSIGNFSQTKVLRGMDGIDGPCTKSVSKELTRILKNAPIIEVKDEIDAFILAIHIIIRED